MLPDAIGSKRVVRVDVIEILWETLMDLLLHIAFSARLLSISNEPSSAFQKSNNLTAATSHCGCFVYKHRIYYQIHTRIRTARGVCGSCSLFRFDLLQIFGICKKNVKKYLEILISTKRKVRPVHAGLTKR